MRLSRRIKFPCAFVGLDLSLNDTGLAILYENDGMFYADVKSGKLRGVERLNSIREQIMSILRKQYVFRYNTFIGIEGYAFGAFGNAIYGIGEIGGVIRWSLYNAGLDFCVIPPTRIKKYVTGKGNANKEMMVSNINRLYLKEFKKKDHNIADALGLAGLIRDYVLFRRNKRLGSEVLFQLEQEHYFESRFL